MPEETSYITAAIAYVNAAPHIGHAFEFTQADVLKRFNKILGCETLLLTGSDENSLKNVQAAEKQKISTQELCDRNTELFLELAKKINISYEVFVRSSDKNLHWPGVFELWKKCAASGDLYKKNYKGLYCVACEAFYTEDELNGGLCPVHNTKPDLVEEENYFFRLSKYQDQLKELIETDEFRIVPETRKNEILSFINSGLEDFSVSRSVARAKGWGVPVPDDPSQIMYVWFDALSCYLTGVGFGSDQKRYEKWWPAEVHVIGKDIIRFHAVYWPAILLSAKIKLPKNLLTHGFLTVEGKKMSKTTGNIVDPIAMIDKYGVDALRYYFIREIPTFQDGDFSEAALKDRYNKELLGDIGNLVSRALTLVEKSGLTTFTGENVLEKNLDLKLIKESFDNLDIHWTLEHIMNFVRSCNKYVNDTAPWKLEGKELEQVLYNLLEALRISSILLWPFIPETAETIARKLGTEIKSTMDLKFRPSFTEKITKGEHLFKKIE